MPLFVILAELVLLKLANGVLVLAGTKLGLNMSRKEKKRAGLRNSLHLSCENVTLGLLSGDSLVVNE